ncbi:nitrate- and nitrite sensing domain-containing protein [Amycolatopsis acidiphila]|uniref:histidine kinase n=1 Tax=Amycolatopsis acidiphila TaxID=715473 RepID=A0A558AJL7_9PSEU|nr:nitrate- and nitrite sensing domain-containing protein [Amycolatopsis acidiphila]TVT24456.1 HAMP domain-containing protein [Amycolatopsis acidiphila]UIJ59335.1 nitrate- and nitrite sensing domain-containing protein [Amycolatopsis acidiphila]GHG79761.1 histidine kinase [Amycolatopsis acidiphila]
MARPRKRPAGGDALERRPEIRVGGRWRLRNWRLRTKLIVVLVIPAVTVLALVGLHVQQDLAHADELAELSAHGRVDAGVNDVIHQLQRERDLSVRFVAADRKGDLTDLRDQRNRVDAAVGAMGEEFDAERSRLSPDGDTELQATIARLNVLTGLRFATEHSSLPADATLRSYSELISGMLDLSDQTVADVTDPDLSRLRLAASALARVKDQMSVKRALLAEALQEGRLSTDEMRALLGSDAELSAARSDFRKFATPAEQRMYDDTVIGLIVDTGNNMVESAITRAEMGQSLSGLDPQQWDTSATYTINLAYQVQQAVQAETQTKIDSLATGARRSAIANAGIVLGVLVLCAVLAVVIARSLLRPLRALRRTALDVADHRLPEAVENILADPHPEGAARRRGIDPVPVFSREELGQVARAFDAVHGQAVRLAGEQALLRENVNAMFVNLSRRSQNLVERQLSVLDRMEADEQDPETLGGLFELDHLATRMRRNSENLLVLSGHDLGDTRTEPVPAEEIIGAALSEVEHYQRIELTATPDLAIVGEATSDLVHVISELLENATLYSPADTTVTVVSAVGDDGAWQVHITDSGAGMPEPEIQRANARLATPPDVDVEVSRRMGLFVVATLARRHDIGVRLRSADGGGLVATVVVPARLLVEQARRPEPGPVAQPVPEPAPVPVPEAPLALPPEVARRAPVEDEQGPDWPSRDNDEQERYYLEDDAPTERLPAYQAVLSQWFHTGEHRPVHQSEAPAHDPEWPADEQPGGSIAERLNGVRHAQPDPVDPPTLRLDPEAVRGRMARLQDGFNRAREARAGARDDAGFRGR